MKSPAKPSPHESATSTDLTPDIPGPTFVRHKDASEEWVYEDEDTALAAWEWKEVYGSSLEQLDDCLLLPNWSSEVEQRNLANLVARRAEALAAWKAGQEELAVAWMNYLHLAKLMRLQGLELRPLARKALPFTKNSGRGEGPIKKLVREVLPALEKRLKRHATAEEVWHACGRRRGHNISFLTDDIWRKPSRAVSATGTSASWARFQVIVSEVRRPAKS